MKKMKRFFALFLAMAMVLGISMTTFAAPVAPKEMPKATVTVNNVAKGSTVTAYQIIRYELNGQYVQVTTGKPADMEAPTADEIWALAQAVKGQEGITLDESQAAPTGSKEGTTAYTKELDAGMWLILVTGSNETIYNPMIASVVVGSDGTTGGTVDADGKFVIGKVELFAKSSTPELEKTTQDQSYELNDNIRFVVKAQIPQYGQNYTSALFKITDELSGGLEFNKDAKITIRDSKDATNGTDYTVANAITYDENKMVVTIDSETILAKGADGKYINTGKYVFVEYSAKLTDETKAGLNSTVNKTGNNVKLEYSNNPFDSTETTEKTDETKQYTFGLNASLGGSDVSNNFVKVEKDTVVAGQEQTYTVLPGAEFELVKENPDSTGESDKYIKINGIANAVTDENGLAGFVGLEGDTDYYLHEVSAPQGYSVEDRYVKVRIHPTYVNGTLTEYTITVGDQSDTLGGEHTMTYKWDDAEKVSTAEGVSNPYNFVNTKLSALPSTGGIGTTIFTVGGCAIMILAAGMFFASRKKASR